MATEGSGTRSGGVAGGSLQGAGGVASWRAEAESVGRRLADELGVLLQAAGWPERSIRSLSRHLGIDANICQRAASAARCGGDPLEALRRTPGIDGLEQLRKACLRRGIDRRLVDAVAMASARLEGLLETFGGSLTRLREALDSEAGQSAAGGLSGLGDQLSARRSACRSMESCPGCSVDTHAVAVFMRESAGVGGLGEREFEGFSVNAYAGWRSRAGGLPLLFSTFSDLLTPERAESLPSDRRRFSGSSWGIVERYSTQPAPVVTLHRARAV